MIITTGQLESLQSYHHLWERKEQPELDEPVICGYCQSRELEDPEAEACSVCQEYLDENE